MSVAPAVAPPRLESGSPWSLVVGQWNDFKVSGAGDLIAGLRLIEIEGHDVGLAIADIAAKHFH
jgi:hypothetical protein